MYRLNRDPGSRVRSRGEEVAIGEAEAEGTAHFGAVRKRSRSCCRRVQTGQSGLDGGINTNTNNTYYNIL